jgi:hypothetical protein
MSTKRAAPVTTLGEFIQRVSDLRAGWKLPQHKELWFRGEGKGFGETFLRPELYRPAIGVDRKPLPLRPIRKLLGIENDLHDEFQRNAAEHQSDSTDDWDWNSYFLMQHHEGPTRLLDWSDGSLIALHFAIRNKGNDSENARVFVLEPYRLIDKLKKLPDAGSAKKAWRKFAAKNPNGEYAPDAWDDSYLPVTEKLFDEIPVPRSPLVMEFAHITRRIAAQRSRFVVLGTEPDWMQDEFKKTNSTIKLITIAPHARAQLRQELRDSGVTESVIYPDLDGLGREMKQLWEDRRLHQPKSPRGAK